MKTGAGNFHFQDRRQAGRELASCLALPDKSPTGYLVLGLPRGGVPVAYEVASAFNWPLDVWIVRKLGLPGHEELAMGAISTGGACVLNEDVIAYLPNWKETVKQVKAAELIELERREDLYRRGRDPIVVAGKNVILVDDGLATGATMRSAVQSVKQLGALRVIAAAPVGSVEACALLRKEADAVVCPFTPDPFIGVGRFYQDFSQTTDQEVCDLLSPSD
jgi:predicted phosphoribosyltransferase